MRLDELLVELGYFSSRTKAKRAILSGHIIVNDKVIMKPSFRVTGNEKIVVLSYEHEKPLGYIKLKFLEEQYGSPIIEPGDIILDIGSSAGGFILYALEKQASKVFGIEISEMFRPMLESIEKKYTGRVRIIFNDIIKVSFNDIGVKVDKILCDITAEHTFILKVIKHVLPILKENGIILFSIKVGATKKKEIPNEIEKIELKIYAMGLKVLARLKSLPRKKEIFYICSKVRE